MRVKMKMRQKFKFTATAALLAFGVGNKGYSQNTSQAVMSVQVAVVAGSHFTNNTISDISDQLSSNEGKVTFGNFKLNVTDGADFLINQDSAITMKGEKSNWLIRTNMTQERSPGGQVTVHMKGDTLSRIPSGVFEGRHVTEIQYL